MANVEAESICHVAGNVKGEFSHEIAPLTLLVGKNASGKSRVMDALSLAVSGEARTDGIGKKGVDLMSLAPPGSDELWAEVKTSTGRTASWRCQGSTASAKRPEHSGLQTTMLCDEAYAMLRGDQRKLREAIMRRIGGEVSREELEKCIPPALWESWVTHSKVEGDTWTVDAVADAITSIGSRLRALGVLRRQTQAIHDSDMPAELSDEERDELSALVTEASRKGMSADAIDALKERRDNLQTALISARAELARLREAPPTGVDEAGIKLLRATKEVHAVLRASLESRAMDTFTCPVCGQKGAELAGLLDRQKDASGVLEQLLNRSMAAKQYTQSIHLAESQEATLVRQVSDVERQIGQATLKAPIDEERLKELRDREAAVERFLAAKAVMQEYEAEERGLKTLKGIAERDVLGAMLDKRVEAFAKRVSDALPKGMSCKIALRDGNRQICRVSLCNGRRGGSRDFRALSGAERATLVAAFAAAVANGEGLKLVLIDDVWFDPEMLKEFMLAMKGAVDSGRVSQVIMSAVTWHGRAKVPAGWNIVHVDSGKES